MTCAYAVRGALKKMKGVGSVEVSLNKGLAEVKLKPGNTLQPKDFWAVVRSNGFTPKQTRVTVRGRVDGDGGLHLAVAGAGKPFDLNGDAKTLEAARQLIGRKVEVEGSLMPGRDINASVPIEAVSLKEAP